MKIIIKNLGPIKQAEFILGDLTIICGDNNTGKTYATYALFGFLKYWHDAYEISIQSEYVDELLEVGSIKLNINDYVSEAECILKKASEEYTKNLPDVFASSKKHFSDTYFMVDVDLNNVEPLSKYEVTMGTAKTKLFSISKQEGSPFIVVSLLAEKDKVKIEPHLINRTIGDALKEIIFSRLLPRQFIASAERTGAAIFRKELNFARNRILEEMSSVEKDINPFKLLSKVYADYALPVKTNVDFTRNLESLVKNDSFIKEQHEDILEDFKDIIGGNYRVTKDDELCFVPRNTSLKLTMDESSSAVRSLLDIGFYLRHVAEPGDLLMIDEPELNLHPGKQRRVARLLSRLVNIGIRVYVTTHSDYFIKELNTLIMLNQEDVRLKHIAQVEGYRENELMDPERIRVYVADKDLVLLNGHKKRSKCQTLIQANIDLKMGVDAFSFDKTIEDMNRIQDEIIWGGDD